MASKNIQWHPGFYAGMELDLRGNELEFEKEFQLTKGPLSIDLLIIRKLNDAPIENDIGSFFRRHNIVEFKSPDDQLTIDVFYKTQAYAALYKSNGERVDAIPAEQVTVTLVRDTYPRNMFSCLKQREITAEAVMPGIYYLSGPMLFETQVVVTSELPEGTHPSLKLLSRKVRKADIEAFIRAVDSYLDSGDQQRADAVLEVSTSANEGTYSALYDEEGRRMSEALMRIMKKDIDLKVAEGRAEGEAKGRAEGGLEGSIRTLWELVNDHLIDIDVASARVNMSVTEFKERAEALMAEKPAEYKP